MSRMTFKYYRALKATLDMLSNKCSKGVLVYGANTIEQKTFCKIIDLRKAAKRLLSCTGIEIEVSDIISQLRKPSQRGSKSMLHYQVTPHGVISHPLIIGSAQTSQKI